MGTTRKYDEPIPAHLAPEDWLTEAVERLAFCLPAVTDERIVRLGLIPAACYDARIDLADLSETLDALIPMVTARVAHNAAMFERLIGVRS